MGVVPLKLFPLPKIEDIQLHVLFVEVVPLKLIPLPKIKDIQLHVLFVEAVPLKLIPHQQKRILSFVKV